MTTTIPFRILPEEIRIHPTRAKLAIGAHTLNGIRVIVDLDMPENEIRMIAGGRQVVMTLKPDRQSVSDAEIDAAGRLWEQRQ